MANQVFANGLEISCKSAGGKSIACMPDVCFTPGPPPPGVPIPYPNTAMSSDTTKGSKTVKITGKETMLRNKSCFKTSTGDEAGSAPKKGTVTGKIKGKTYFSSWSMDVKIEGENAVRHTDIMTHNHGSFPGNTPTWPYVDEAAIEKDNKCAKDKEKERKACEDLETDDKGKKLTLAAQKAKRCDGSKESNKCREAQRCMLQPCSPNRCCSGEQPHHLVEVHAFSVVGNREQPLAEFSKYNYKKAPCVCASGPRNKGKHGKFHKIQGMLERAYHAQSESWTYAQARETGVFAHSLVFRKKCEPDCIRQQLDAYHKQEGVEITDSSVLRTDPQAGSRSSGTISKETIKTVSEQAKAVMNVVTRSSGRG